MIVKGKHSSLNKNRTGSAVMRLWERSLKNESALKLDSLVSMKKELELLAQQTSVLPREKNESMIGKRSTRKERLDHIEF